MFISLLWIYCFLLKLLEKKVVLNYDIVLNSHLQNILWICFINNGKISPKSKQQQNTLHFSDIETEISIKYSRLQRYEFLVSISSFICSFLLLLNVLLLSDWKVKWMVSDKFCASESRHLWVKWNSDHCLSPIVFKTPLLRNR